MEGQLNTSLYRDLQIFKKLLQSAITSDAGLRLLAPLRPRCATVLYLHRFAMPDFEIRGHDPVVLSQHLEYLRRRRYTLMSAMELLRHLDERIPFPETAVVFTVDDGYADFAEVGAPVFAAYDCPVTVFLVTDFVSGRLWCWFDRIAWAFTHSARRDVALEILGQRVWLRWTNPAECERASDDVVERLKRVEDAVKEEVLLSLAGALELEIPDRVPEQYKAMNWDQVRACESLGATFGPHSVSHPILSRVDASRSDREISASWQAVATGTDAAVPIFCYPNGTAADFSSREKESIARSSMAAAVSTTSRPLEACLSSNATIDRFAIPRIAYSEQKRSFVQIVSGLEAMKTRITERYP